MVLQQLKDDWIGWLIVKHSNRINLIACMSCYQFPFVGISASVERGIMGHGFVMVEPVIHSYFFIFIIYSAFHSLVGT